MPYLVRAKGRPVRLRDIGREGRPMIVVGPDPVPFVTLPPASLRLPGGDKDVEVAPLKNLEGYQLPDPVAARAPVKEQADTEAEAPATGDTAEPRKRRGHR